MYLHVFNVECLFHQSLLQVTKGMFGATRKKFGEFVEVVDNDFSDENMYYNQPSMFPHRSDKDVSSVSHRHMYYNLSHSRVAVLSLNHSLCSFPSDALVSLAIVVWSAVAIWCKFVRSTKLVFF